MTANPIRIDIFADIACPWCYIGEARLNAALAERPELDVRPTWQPFQLQPELPSQGLPWRGFAEKKFGGWERALQMFAQVAAAGREAGLTFNFEAIARANNTAAAHRLVLKAQAEGRGIEAAHDLFKTYFEEGEDLNSLETLLGVARNVGLDEEETRAHLLSDEGRAEVAASQARAATLGVTGVPFYVFDNRYGVSGAQPKEVFTQVLDELTAGAGAPG